MSLSMLLAVLTVASAVGVMGVLTGLTATSRSGRARGWLLMSLGLAIGVAVCAFWNHLPGGRVIAAVLVLQGWAMFERTLHHTEVAANSRIELITEPRP